MFALSCHVGTTVRFFLNPGKMKIFLARTCLLTKQRCAKTRGASVCGDDVTGVYEIRVSPGYLQFAPDTPGGHCMGNG